MSRKEAEETVKSLLLKHSSSGTKSCHYINWSEEDDFIKDVVDKIANAHNDE